MESTPEPLAGLVREHRTIEGIVDQARTAITAAAGQPGDASLVDGALEQVWRLQQTLERDVAIHIEKEERVLFPVLRAEIARLSELIDDMIAEHDVVKQQRDTLRRTLATLDDDHDAVQAAGAKLLAGLSGVSDADPASTLTGLRDTVQYLDWVFQGHFTGEEDGLFLPAEDLLSPATFADMVRQMAAIEAEAASTG